MNKDLIMWYAIIGVMTCIIGYVRERKGLTVGNADEMLVLSIMMFWPLFISVTVYGYIKRFLSIKI